MYTQRRESVSNFCCSRPYLRQRELSTRQIALRWRLCLGDLAIKASMSGIVMAAIKQYGGVYVAAGPGTMIDGSFPKGRVVILQWESMDAMHKWHESPEYQAALKIGKAYAHYNVVAVDGVTP